MDFYLLAWRNADYRITGIFRISGALSGVWESKYSLHPEILQSAFRRSNTAFERHTIENGSLPLRKLPFVARYPFARRLLLQGDACASVSAGDEDRFIAVGAFCVHDANADFCRTCLESGQFCGGEVNTCGSGSELFRDGLW